MAATSFAPHSTAGRRIPLAEIDAAVAARLGATRGLGNSQPACFNPPGCHVFGEAYRQLEYQNYWTLLRRSRSFDRLLWHPAIEALRDSDANVDALVCELRRHLLQEHDCHHDDENSGGGSCPALSVENWRTGSRNEFVSG